MKVSEKADAEFINSAVFRINNKINVDDVFYKAGLLILSGKASEIEKSIKYIDFIMGRIDYYIIKNEMKKALVYTVLLNRRVIKLVKKIKTMDVDLSSAS